MGLEPALPLLGGAGLDCGMTTGCFLKGVVGEELLLLLSPLWPALAAEERSRSKPLPKSMLRAHVGAR